MKDSIITFSRENISGVAPVGSWLIDVMGRVGIRSEEPCDPLGDLHVCPISIESGAELLSPLSKIEVEHFKTAGRKDNERLACQTKIVAPGEIVIMTTETDKKEPAEDQQKRSKFVDEFETLPLQEKISNLLRMEAVTLGETLSFVANSPFKVFEKIGDVMAEFGMKLEREAKKAARPDAEAPNGGTAGSKPKKPAAKKTPPPRRKPTV